MYLLTQKSLTLSFTASIFAEVGDAFPELGEGMKWMNAVAQ